MLKQLDIFARRLKVANVYYSSHIDIIAESYIQSISNLRLLPRKGDRIIYSSITSESINWSELRALN